MLKILDKLSNVCYNTVLFQKQIFQHNDAEEREYLRWCYRLFCSTQVEANLPLTSDKLSSTRRFFKGINYYIIARLKPIISSSSLYWKNITEKGGKNENKLLDDLLHVHSDHYCSHGFAVCRLEIRRGTDQHNRHRALSLAMDFRYQTKETKKKNRITYPSHQGRTNLFIHPSKSTF